MSAIEAVQLTFAGYIAVAMQPSIRAFWATEAPHVTGQLQNAGAEASPEGLDKVLREKSNHWTQHKAGLSNHLERDWHLTPEGKKRFAALLSQNPHLSGVQQGHGHFATHENPQLR